MEHSEIYDYPYYEITEGDVGRRGISIGYVDRTLAAARAEIERLQADLLELKPKPLEVDDVYWN